MPYYSHNIIEFEDFDFDDILINEKSLKIRSISYQNSYQILIDAKLLPIRFDKIDGFIRTYDGNRYLVFGLEKHGAIYNRIRYLISQKPLSHMFSHTITQTSKLILTFLCLEKKTLTLHNIITLIKLVLNKDQNQYYYNIFVEKCTYQLAKK